VLGTLTAYRTTPIAPNKFCSMILLEVDGAHSSVVGVFCSLILKRSRERNLTGVIVTYI